eukprot:gene10931-3637_t
MDENYMIHYESAFSNKTVGEALRKHLSVEFNEEPFDFIMKINEMKNSHNTKEKIKLINDILDLYLQTGSEHEVNISGKSKKEIFSIFEEQKENHSEWVLTIPMNNFFDKVEKIVKEELYHDPWKRFIRSSLSLSIIQKFHEDPTVCSPQITEQFDYSDDHFTHPFIEDDDFRFAKVLFQDNYHWKLIGQKSDVKGNNYHCRQNFLPKLSFGKNIQGIKHECVYNYNLESFLLAKLTFLNKIGDPNITRMKTLCYHTKEELLEIYKGKEKKISKYYADSAASASDCYFGYLFNPRYLVCGQKIFYDKESNTVILIAKPYVTDGLEFSKPSQIEMLIPGEKSPKFVKAYPMFNWIFNFYQQIDDHKTLFTQINLLEPGGWLNSDFLIKQVSKRRGENYQDLMMELIENIPEGSNFKELQEKYKNSNEISGFDRLLLSVDLK